MKKIFLVLFLVSTLFFYFNAFSATKCSTFNSESSISDSINDCLSDSKVLVQANWWDLNLTWWFKSIVNEWIMKIASVLSLIAVWALVYAGFLFVMSSGEDEKIKKAKDITKWTILWFIWVIWASSLIAIVINVMYSV